MKTIDENSVVLNCDDDDTIMNAAHGGNTIFTTYEDNNNIKVVKLKRFVNDFNIQHKMFNYFHGKTGGYVAYRGTQWYGSSVLLCRNSSVESFSIVLKFIQECGMIVYHFELFQTKLKSLLCNKLNCSIKDNKSSGINRMNNIYPLLVYFYIWNGIYCIIKDLKYRFDCKIGFESNILNRDNNIFVIDLNQIKHQHMIKLLIHWLLNFKCMLHRKLKLLPLCLLYQLQLQLLYLRCHQCLVMLNMMKSRIRIAQ